MPKSEEKIRIYLSTLQATEYLNYLVTSGSSDEKLIRSIQKHLILLDAGIKVPDYKTNPRESIVESLGFDANTGGDINNDAPYDPDANRARIAAKRKALYTAWVNNPESVSASDLEQVWTYMLHNGLLTQEEYNKKLDVVLGADDPNDPYGMAQFADLFSTGDPNLTKENKL